MNARKRRRAVMRQHTEVWGGGRLDLIPLLYTVATRYRSWGVQTGPFLGIAGHGQRIDILETSWFRMEGARIAEQWAFPDSSLMNQQMGAS